MQLRSVPAALICLGATLNKADIMRLARNPDEQSTEDQSESQPKQQTTLFGANQKTLPRVEAATDRPGSSEGVNRVVAGQGEQTGRGRAAAGDPLVMVEGSGKAGKVGQAPEVKANTIFTKEAADAAIARLKAKFNRLNTGQSVRNNSVTLRGKCQSIQKKLYTDGFVRCS